MCADIWMAGAPGRALKMKRKEVHFLELKKNKVGLPQWSSG